MDGDGLTVCGQRAAGAGRCGPVGWCSSVASSRSPLSHLTGITDAHHLAGQAPQRPEVGVGRPPGFIDQQHVRAPRLGST